MRIVYVKVNKTFKICLYTSEFNEIPDGDESPPVKTIFERVAWCPFSKRRRASKTRYNGGKGGAYNEFLSPTEIC